MSRIKKYRDFISENIFNTFKVDKVMARKTKLQKSVDDIMNFLRENQIVTWDDFETMSSFDRQIVDKLIDSNGSNMDELKEIRFELKLQMCNKLQLKQMIKDLETDEEYEKCSRVLKKINKL